MSPIRVLIVDDEPLARDRLRNLLEEDDEVTVVAECDSGPEAVAWLCDSTCDLVLLDVQMPQMNGFEVLEAVGPARMPPVIFVTAFDEHALRAFEVSALDYLLKPFDGERFQKALARAKSDLQRRDEKQAHEKLLALLQDVTPAQKPLDRIVIKTSGKVLFLKTEEIDWIEAAGNYLRLHAGDEMHLIRETMSTLEGRLDPHCFCRIHRSTIVNLERIKELQPLFHGDYVVTLKNGTELTLSRTFRQRLPEDLREKI